ncbi:hypothetical protein AOQ84DRAFT_227753 [Glonium stellatum]|uniref:Only prolin and serin are matching in the corresponding protein n=1 Tax=Glonium stellatum TaxID=574774 RepID=A0A8E2F8S0_9PEZI|nr:hypothetical protein AOQ84DRAFT_227753 [Glonium stellatum]
MREMRPLILPNLVASRNPPKICTDMPADPVASVYSCTDSGFYSVSSDCSAPLTPTFSSRGHKRYPSSNSSLSSSPPSYDFVEIPNGSGKLPKLTEEPIEPETEFVMLDAESLSPCLCDVEFCAHNMSSDRRSLSGQSYDLADGCFADDSEYATQHMAKRQKSGDSPVSSIANKIESRFPSLSRRLKDRKKSSGLSITSKTGTPARVPSTRSSSITSSINRGLDQSEKLSPSTPARSSNERLNETSHSSPIDIIRPNSNGSYLPESIDRERLISTPLLPPMMVKLRTASLPTQSPLQSPTVADSYSTGNTPVGTPPGPGLHTPPLSSKPSASSLKASRPGHLVASPEIPPIIMADPNDEWSNKLGHANFTIYPEPYVPDFCDTASCRRLFADWEQARRNFTKHQVRTGEHFGVTSKTYMLTEQKWAEIDAEWKKSNDIAISKAAEIGQEPGPSSPSEPAPLIKMPSLNDPKSEGKFPKLGDEDIVGPMVQIASQVQQRPSRKRAFFKFFSDMKLPGSFLGRYSHGTRPR